MDKGSFLKKAEEMVWANYKIVNSSKIWTAILIKEMYESASEYSGKEEKLF